MIISREEIYSDVAENNQGDVGGYLNWVVMEQLPMRMKQGVRQARSWGCIIQAYGRPCAGLEVGGGLAHSKNCQKTDVPGVVNDGERE